MRNYLRLMLGLYLFWMLYFFILRCIFIICQLFSGFKINFSETSAALFQGAYMDLSMASYFMIIPLLLYFIHRWIPYNKVVFYYTLLFIVINSAIYAGDAVLYREWGYRLDKSVFAYLNKFNEASSFVSVRNSIMMMVLLILNVGLGVTLFRKINFKYFYQKNSKLYFANFLFLPLLIIPIRGGLDIIPMNPGKVYFSSEPFPNHIALNVPWNIMYSALQVNQNKENLHFMDDSQSEMILDTLFANKNSAVDTILKIRRPKILFLILESFTSKLIHKTFEGIEVTPRLNAWFDQGIYFNNAYASGDRTEIGIAAIFSGFPAQPQSAIVHYPRKTAQLPSLIRNLKQGGYNTSFYYGGDASFASMSSYLFNMGCDKIIDKHQFSKNTYNAKWGVHDHILFERFFEDIKNDSSQFLKICLSLSSHPPYDIPEPPTWMSNDEEISFLNTAHYTDKHLGMLLDKLHGIPLWNDLLIVVCADHGARFPGNDLYQVPQKFKIPVWIGGGAVSRRTKMEQVISQNDIAPSLLYQLGLNYDDFKYGKNVFSKTCKSFAYYAFNNGFGWMDSGGFQVYSNDKREVIFKDGNPEMDIQIGKAYLQNVISDFNKM